MYKRARIKLTVFYSLIIITFFWLTSLALYLWFSHTIAEGYVAKVKELHKVDRSATTFDEEHVIITKIAGDIAEKQLRNVLLLINIPMLIIVPSLAWILTGRTLSPIEQVYEQQKLFVSDASHEMRTPLSVLSIEMEIALKKDQTVGQYKKIIISLREEVDRMKVLIENLLFLARSDIGKLDGLAQPVDITDLISTVISQLHLKISEKNLKIAFFPAKEVILVKGHSQMLSILFSNLIDNAIKYTPNNGKINLEIKNSHHEVIISIQDNGVGISNKNLRKIFDRFYRVDDSRSQTKGFGLGLAIVKSIIKQHQGRITVDSQTGRGTTFTVSLPRA